MCHAIFHCTSPLTQIPRNILQGQTNIHSKKKESKVKIEKISFYNHEQALLQLPLNRAILVFFSYATLTANKVRYSIWCFAKFQSQPKTPIAFQWP